MMRGDGGSHARVATKVSSTHVIHRLLCGDVLENNAQSWITLSQGNQMAFDEQRFPVEDIHVRVGHLTVDQQGHVDGLHAGQHP